MQNEKMFEMSADLKITVTACFTIGSIFTGANGLIAVSLIAACAAVATGVLAVVEVSQTSRKLGFILGIIASVFSVLGPAFVLTASTALPFMATVAIAVIPALLWVALAVTLHRGEGTKAPN